MRVVAAGGTVVVDFPSTQISGGEIVIKPKQPSATPTIGAAPSDAASKRAVASAIMLM